MNEEKSVGLEELDAEIATITEKIDTIHDAANDPDDDTPLTVIEEDITKLYSELAKKTIMRIENENRIGKNDLLPSGKIPMKILIETDNWVNSEEIKKALDNTYANSNFSICSCGGFVKQVETTDAEEKKYGCDRKGCCVKALQCNKCKVRFTLNIKTNHMVLDNILRGRGHNTKSRQIIHQLIEKGTSHIWTIRELADLSHVSTSVVHKIKLRLLNIGVIASSTATTGRTRFQLTENGRLELQKKLEKQ